MLEALQRYLASSERDMFRFLRELVLQPSFSRDKDDVDAVGRVVAGEMAELPMGLETLRQETLGNQLLFRSPACSRHERSILLVGHMDTVFPRASGFNWYREEGTRVSGPGVIDMKGGLVVAIFALKALNSLGLLAEIPVTLVCNSDEEIGSPGSTGLLAVEASRALFGLVFECGGLDGQVVTGRKGRTGYELAVAGRAGHAAFAGAGKASAILEAAHKVVAIENLNDLQRQLVVNVGTIRGGIGPNTVPESAVLGIDTRFLTKGAGEACGTALARIAEESTVAGTSSSLTEISGREPMERSPGNVALYHHVAEVAMRLGMRLGEETRSGVSDANTLAASGLPVLDGLGPIGGDDHSDREYMLRTSLLPRTVLAAAAIATGWSDFKG